MTIVLKSSVFEVQLTFFNRFYLVSSIRAVPAQAFRDWQGCNVLVQTSQGN